jgi:hypothetical protein
MSDERVRAALREIADAAPIHPDAAAAMVEKQRPPRLVPALAAGAVVLTIAAAILFRLPSGTHLPAADGRPTLPDRFPAFSFVQGTTDGRFGRAIALYVNGSGHEDFSFSQLILAGADRDTYRRIAVPDVPNGGLAPARLSPDGTKVAIGGDGITVIDLIRGDRTSTPISSPAGVVPLAFAPDGRHIAYTRPAERGGSGPLSILDISNGGSTSIAGGTIIAAAFSPDGSRLAYQIGYPPAEEISISRLDGTLESRLTLPARTQLAGAAAWSPDGRFLVVIATGPDRPEGNIIYGGDQTYVFLPLEPTGGAAPAPVPGKGLTPGSWGDAVLGWQSPTRMLVSTGDVDGTTSNLIVSVDITTGGHEVISRFAVGAHDDLAVGDVQLATALLGDVGIRHSTDPDRGPWPAWAIITSAVCLGVFALLALWWLRRNQSSRASFPTMRSRLGLGRKA